MRAVTRMSRAEQWLHIVWYSVWQASCGQESPVYLPVVWVPAYCVVGRTVTGSSAAARRAQSVYWWCVSRVSWLSVTMGHKSQHDGDKPANAMSPVCAPPQCTLLECSVNFKRLLYRYPCA